MLKLKTTWEGNLKKEKTFQGKYSWERRSLKMNKKSNTHGEGGLKGELLRLS